MRHWSNKDRSAAAVFFQYLVTPSGSKIAYPVNDLIVFSRRSKADVERILRALEDERVLRHIPPPSDQPGTVRYEIFHDVLANAILDWRSRFLQAERSSRMFAIGQFVTYGVILVILSILIVLNARNILERLESFGNDPLIVAVLSALSTLVIVFFNRILSKISEVFIAMTKIIQSQISSRARKNLRK